MLKLVIRTLFKAAAKQRKRQARPRPAPSVPTPASDQRSVSVSCVADQSSAPASCPSTLTGKCYVIDGDTIQIGKVRLRLAGIDAPELDHPWGKKAKWELVQLCKGRVITAEIEPEISYDRVVATCFLPDGRDLSAEMVTRGLALDWPKFSGGKYAHLEPDGVRKKHWKAAARQRGNMSVFHK
ncbi:thermonuclease family protein [Rhodovulum sp. P5]|uniref:thermonuclease family protein n=1 Tax=Rhodovulum sp. P5 TaxID=1564506 RepID=UPI0020A40C73|nr:thermonuclease family protein [Rhodovulum sp. P5]